jgi:FMN-dependent NADH-azoreductase
MTTPQTTIHDVATGEMITRDMNETELAQLEADIAQAKKDAAAQAKADQAAADKRQIILDRLGITTDEFKTLIS